VGSPEFHPQPTSGQNTLRSLLLAGGFNRIPHPINFRPKQQQTQIISKIDQTQIHKSGDTSKQGLQNILQQISWVCIKSNKRFTHTAGSSQHSQHTQPKLLTPPQRTHQIGQLRKNPQKTYFNLWKSSEITLQPLDDDPQPAGKSVPLLDGNQRLCLPIIGASARQKKSAPLLGRPTFLRSPSPILFLPSSSNPKWGSGGHAGLKERDGDEK